VLRFAATGGPLVIAQPSGKPISWQTHAGESAAATVASDCTASASEFRLPCDGGAVAFCASLTVGVDQSLICECSVSAVPRCRPLSNSARGVAQVDALTAVCRPNCTFAPCGVCPVALVPAGTVRPPVTSPTDGVGHW